MPTANPIPSASEGQEEINATDQTMPIDYVHHRIWKRIYAKYYPLSMAGKPKPKHLVRAQVNDTCGERCNNYCTTTFDRGLQYLHWLKMGVAAYFKEIKHNHDTEKRCLLACKVDTTIRILK